MDRSLICGRGNMVKEIFSIAPIVGAKHVSPAEQQNNMHLSDAETYNFTFPHWIFGRIGWYCGRIVIRPYGIS